jgi:hypothetical protein
MRQFGEILPDAPLRNMEHFKDGLFFLYVWGIARYDVAENREDGTTMLLWGSSEVDQFALFLGFEPIAEHKLPRKAQLLIGRETAFKDFFTYVE